ncbi:hypothetical protein [Streptomyces sp. RKAG290]|uniref:DUF7134 domain-containing protein n=1 Tax=Streptomyces sp. RKAG290 TaxID=2888348 RepID=UPI002033C3EA|nr:hypothetical protein [Streptomyces sp. RKAG290]MCM2411387.1 hypothetical protein [Streptomyces sp. RKAG290]
MRIRTLTARARRAGPRTVDLLITLLVQAAMTMPFVVPRAPELPDATWTAYGLTTLTVLPLAARRRAPVAVLIAVLVAGALYKFAVDGPGQPLPYTGLLAIYTVAELSSPPKRFGIAGLTALAVLVSVGLDSDALRELLFSLFVFAAAYAFGRLAVTRKAYLRAVEDRALFGGRVVRGPLLEEMFTLPGSSVREYGTGKPAAYGAGLSVMTLGGREVWGKTGGRWGYNTVIAATRGLSRTLVYSVDATDAKGEGMNATAMKIVVAAFGAPSAG